MILSTRDTERFYRVWFPLLHFVNQRLQLVAHFPEKWGPHGASTQDAGTLRDALWADDALREAFIAENPADFDAPDLALVANWQRRVTGDFYFLRQLKKYAVFLTRGDAAQAYGVLGLVSPLDEIVPTQPTMLQTTLLPFEGKIIYDSLLVGYNVIFGPGIRADLNAAYRVAQERGTLLTTLDATAPDDEIAAIRTRNAKLLVAFQKQLTGSNIGLATIEGHRATIKRFATDHLLRQQPPRGLIALQPGELMPYLRQMGKAASSVSFRHFVRFLRDTARIDWQHAESLLAELKGA